MKEILGIKTYSRKETAKILGLCELTVLRYLQKGKIVGQKSGRRWIVTEDNIKKYLHGETISQENVNNVS